MSENTPQHKKAEVKPLVYKTVYVTRGKDPQDARTEKILKIGTHAECNAALENAEKEALSGKSTQFDLKVGHFALLVANENEVKAGEGKVVNKPEEKTAKGGDKGAAE
ncbi:MAG TPA: hypothetical protein PKY99_00170 [Turneriella sp.]|nr:hypothetical protein [Turneriella sp.]